jgi:transcriptional regulator with XRE-family HTH domain
MTRIDQQRLITLRMQRGLAVRQLARDCGIEIAVLNRLETATDPSLTTLSVAALARLADRLGVPVGILFTEDTQPARTDATTDDESVGATADAAALGALLTALGKNTPVVAIADALNWTSRRVHSAAANLDTNLRVTGMTVYKNSGLIGIQPASDTHTDAEIAVRRHPRSRGNQRLVNPTRSRLLYKAARTPISPHSLSAADRIQVATLLKAGVLVENDQRCLIPSPDVTASLYTAAD